MPDIKLICAGLSLFGAMALAGCVTTSAGSNESIKPRVAASKEKAEALLATRGAATDRTLANPVTYSNESWIPMRKVERTARDRELAKTDAISLEVNQRFGSLNEVAGAVSSYTGLPVAIDPDC